MDIEQETPIGYLLAQNISWERDGCHNPKAGFVVYCLDCVPVMNPPGAKNVPVYHVNIGSYKQHCGNCHKLLHKGKTEAWPELFDGTQR